MNTLERNYLILRRFRIGEFRYTATELDRYCDLMWNLPVVRDKIRNDYKELRMNLKVYK